MIGLLCTILILGVILWGVAQLPIDPTIVKIVRVVVIVLIAIYVIQSISGQAYIPMFTGHFGRE